MLYAINICAVAQKHLGGFEGGFPLPWGFGVVTPIQGGLGVESTPSMANPGLWGVRCAEDFLGLYIKVLPNFNSKVQ